MEQVGQEVGDKNSFKESEKGNRVKGGVPASNLLAFSGGVDSSALFFWLLERQIDFDLALVNYKTRPESDKEMEFALQLGKKYQKRVYIQIVSLSPFSELEARRIRYRFFEKLIKRFNYRRLILGHQLNDRLEWLLMELGKGAGVVEMVGMEEWEKRNGYHIWRPFAFKTRREIEEFLSRRKLPYFQDHSNWDNRYLRNFIRHRFATPFIDRFGEGVRRSFHYLERDKGLLLPIEEVKQVADCYFFPKTTPLIDIRLVDRLAKRLGVVMSASQRQEVVRQNFSAVVGGKVAIDKNSHKIFISPFVKIPLGRWKEICRGLRIPPKVRGYLVKENLCGILFTAMFTDV